MTPPSETMSIRCVCASRFSFFEWLICGAVIRGDGQAEDLAPYTRLDREQFDEAVELVVGVLAGQECKASDGGNVCRNERADRRRAAPVGAVLAHPPRSGWGVSPDVQTLLLLRP
jgi:hypothetical protein